MKILIYDCEVFAFDWMFVFYDIKLDKFLYVHNNPEELKEIFTSPLTIFGGFNIKHYDNYIVKAILLGYENPQVKHVSDQIINEDKQGWECDELANRKLPYFYSFDLIDDIVAGQSLKSIEGHLGYPIVESSVPFDIPRRLKTDEIEETFKYCKTDVVNTCRFLKIRERYLLTKISLGKMAGLPDYESIALTNAKLSAKYLGAVRKNWSDGRNYIFPNNLDYTRIPKKVFTFFKQIKNQAIHDKELYSTSLKIDIGNCPCTYRWGGVHGSLTKYHAKADLDYIIVDSDVSSLYPSLAIKYNYMSRNVANPQAFVDTVAKRLKAKADGDKALASTLKTPINVYTGALGQQFNDLYDPLQSISIRITGQLALTELTCTLVEEIPSFELLNLNTDGIMYRVKYSEWKKIQEICSAWEKRTMLTLEHDFMKEIYIESTNTLFAIMSDGSTKSVGAATNWGISEKGAWSINNNLVAVKKALVSYLKHEKSIEQSIFENNNLIEYQMIAKAGASYKMVSYTIDGQTMPIQKVNRCYATSDTRYGTIRKRHQLKETDDLIGNLPEHVIIDNNNERTIKDIDKSWYVERAIKMYEDYTGEIYERDYLYASLI